MKIEISEDELAEMAMPIIAVVTPMAVIVFLCLFAAIFQAAWEIGEIIAQKI